MVPTNLPDVKRRSASKWDAAGASGESKPEARHRAAATLAWAALLHHSLVFPLSLREGDHPEAVMALAGLVISVLMVRVSRRSGGLEAVQRWALALVGAWLTLDLVQGARLGQGLTEWMLIDVFILALMLFAFLPARRAAAWSVAAYASFAGAAVAAGQTDPTPVLAMGLVIGLTSFLTSYGKAVAQEQAQVALLQRQLREDGLTGVLNRAAAQEAVGALLLEHQGTVLFADIDHFKAINDRFGHLAGDEALRQVAQCLHQTVGDQGQVGRWGGEEFIVLLPGAGAARAQEIAERLLCAVRSTAGDRPPLTLSIGGASLAEASTLHGLIELADRRLYAAKDLGRDCVVLADPPEGAGVAAQDGHADEESDAFRRTLRPP